MNDTLTEENMDIFENLFHSDGRWILCKYNTDAGVTASAFAGNTHEAIGPFDSEEGAITFRDSYLSNNYHVVEVKDPEDVLREYHGRNQ